MTEPITTVPTPSLEADSPAPVFTSTIKHGKSLGEIPSIRSYQMFSTNFWDSKAYLKLYYMSDCILIDALGRVVRNGKDMDAAHRDKAFPVGIYLARPEP